MKRIILVLLPVLLALQVGVSPALAWTWPVDGPVLRPFTFDADHPYAGGQHRGIDIGAGGDAPVRAPAAGTVTFAGTVPDGGLTVAIATADGYSATLLHLGSLAVKRGTTVAEGDVVGAVGPSGEPELAVPYVHFGVRVAAETHGYIDPLSLLPPPVAAPPATDDAEEGDAEEVGSGGGSTGGTAAGSEGRAKESAAEPGRRTSVDRSAPVRTAAVLAGVGRSGLAAAFKARGGGPVRQPTTAPLAAHAVAGELQLHSVSASHTPGSPASVGGGGRADGWVGSALLVFVGLAVATALAARKLADARRAHRAAAVLSKSVSAAAEDTGLPRLREDDGVVVDGDLDGILLAKAEALADLDRDDDPAELVDLPHDPPRSASPAPRRRSCARRRLRSHQRPTAPSPAGR